MEEESYEDMIASRSSAADYLLFRRSFGRNLAAFVFILGMLPYLVGVYEFVDLGLFDGIVEEPAMFGALLIYPLVLRALCELFTAAIDAADALKRMARGAK